MKSPHALLLMAVLCCSLAGCDAGAGSSPPTEWPPRLHQLDGEASAIPASAELTWEIDSRKPLRWSGNMNLLGPRFLPVAARFEVSGGVLVSRLGRIEKRATFGGWAPIRKSADDPAPIGWGPCLTEGEVIVPNVFLAQAPEGIRVENRFAAEDLGPDFTLIHIRPEEEDRLCIRFREPLGDTVMFGRMGQEGESTLYGPLESPTLKADYKVFRLGKGVGGTVAIDEPNHDPMLAFTGAAPGAEVQMGDWLLTRKADGWYSGETRLGPK